MKRKKEKHFELEECEGKDIRRKGVHILREEKCGPFVLDPGDTITVEGNIDYYDGLTGKTSKIEKKTYLKYEIKPEDGRTHVDTVYIIYVNGELELETGFGAVIGKKKV